MSNIAIWTGYHLSQLCLIFTLVTASKEPMPPPVEIKDANELMGYYMVSGTGVILFILSCYMVIYSIIVVLIKLHTLSIGTEDQETRQRRRVTK